jgi:CBS domain-containing protein
MRIHEILRDKTNYVVTLQSRALVSQASALMLMERVGAVVVCEGERILGVRSERDLALAISELGPDLFSRCVGELMSVDPPIAAPGDAVVDVMRTMTEKRARHIPVVEGGSVVGMVSIGDILKSRLAEKIQENAVLQDLARVRLSA